MDRGLGSRYVLHEPIGRGAYGDVWRASPRAGGPPLAVKVLKPELAGDDETVGRFLQERSILVGLEHPNLVRVHDLVIEGDTIAIVMDLAAGTDLRRLLTASATQAPTLACEVARQIAAGLAAVHAAGVVHRDVKPENVMVDLATPGLPLVRLTDFGIARLTQSPSVTRMSGIMGTPEYIAPELAGRSAATPAADVYSLGILLYELCVGRTPFGGGHPVAVLRRHMDVAPPRPDGVPDRLWDLIASLLAKDPAARPSAAVAAERLEELVPTFAGMAPLPPMAEADEDDWPAPAPLPAPTPAPSTSLDHTAIPLGLGPAERRPAAPANPRRRHRDRSRTRPAGRTDAGIAGGGRRLSPARWPLLFGGPLLVALVLLGALTWARQPNAEAVTDFLFDGELLEDKELLVGRKWTLSADGDTVFGFLTITNYSERDTFGGAYEEVLPPEMAPDPGAVTSSPSVDDNPGAEAGHSVLRYEIPEELDPRSKLNIAYSVAVEPEEAEGGLERWAEQRVEAVDDYNAWAEENAADVQEVPVRLASFDILTPSPVRLNLETPALRLDVRGELDNGQPAPALVLALIEWTSGDAAVVEVAGGVLAPGRPGATTVRARSGVLERTVEVIVTERGTVSASPAPEPAPLITQDDDFDLVSDPGIDVTDGPGTTRPPTTPPPTTPPPTSGSSTTTPPTTTPPTTVPPLPDADGDGVPDGTDNCPSVPNSDQANTDGVGLGDACDADGDGFADDFDNCPDVPNNQVDTDGTGGGDACDPDDDGDAVEDAVDNCPTAANANQADSDGDEQGDVCDSDRDGDGFPNEDDPFPDDRENQGSTTTSAVIDASTSTT